MSSRSSKRAKKAGSSSSGGSSTGGASESSLSAALVSSGDLPATLPAAFGAGRSARGAPETSCALSRISWAC